MLKVVVKFNIIIIIINDINRVLKSQIILNIQIFVIQVIHWSKVNTISWIYFQNAH